ncbi:xanthan lyase [Prevotella cerevisiae]|uniref:Xanthan lyase n=1 Tax=Segatella cerevisiae TaxID=2053716 RepID=A0ABT1BWX3_9BACT|nr:xanthan lyase [Segatella cerevisiae]MCO6025220.1 xanthan lyase [Segatella cerevisiae]
MKNQLLFKLVFFGCFAPVAIHAQTSTKAEYPVVESILNSYTKGVQTGKIKVNSIVSTNDTLNIFTSDNFSYVPFRNENYTSLIQKLKDSLSSQYTFKGIRLFTDNKSVADLIPRSCLPSKSKRPAFTNPSDIPLVTNLNRPYTPTRGLSGRHIAMWPSHGTYYELGLQRWEWQRARMLQTVEDKYTESYVLPYLVPMLENAGAIVMLPRERDTNPYEVIVDNDGHEATSPYQEINGRLPWKEGTTSGFAYLRKTYKDFENPFTEGTYRETETVNKKKDAGTITWTPDIPKDRDYAVYVSYKSLPNSTTQARYTVYHKDGKTTFSVNQTMGGGTWIYLGTFAFRKGRQGKVVLTNYAPKAGKTITADAIKFGGGMGNIARRADSDSIIPNTKSDRRTKRIPRNAYQPRIDYPYQVSGYPRFDEGARYWLQWAGIPDSVYSPTHGRDDYADDYKDRGTWVNYLAGGTKAVPDYKGLNIPVDLSLAFHSDAGTVYGDSIIGTLGIYDTQKYDGKFADGTSRMACHDLCDLVLSSITNDIRKLYEPKWTRRGMWDASYFEAWEPRVPAMLLELLSHENFADLRYGLDPRFQFSVSRAVYKGILRFLSDEYGYKYVVQPLPVDHFAVVMAGHDQVKLTWKAVNDTLEPTAVPEKYVVYKRIGNGDFDNGTVVKKPVFVCKIPTDQVVSFKVTAFNKGGESFPSEILSAGISSQSTVKPVLVINGFDRLSAPDDFRSSDDKEAGFLADIDNGVPYKTSINYVGKMKEFRRSIPWTDDDSGGFGDSYGNYERMTIAGNTFDYPALHGQAIMSAGYSFVSASKSAAVERELLNTDDYSAVDLILGKEKQTKLGRPGVTPIRFKTFDTDLQKAITTYCKNGGRIFASGSYIASDLWFNPLAPAKDSDKVFAQDILKYKWRVNRAAIDGKVKYSASPLTTKEGEFTYYNTPNEESYVVESPDAIEPADSCAYTALRYSENNLSAGIVFGGSEQDHWRTVVFGFPFESLKGDTARNALMKEILDFLLK